MYHVFTRTWWTAGGRPEMGRKQTLVYLSTQEQAREFALDWNEKNPPGKRSRKAEFEKV